MRDPHSRDFGWVGYVNAFKIVGDVWPEYRDSYGGDDDGELLGNTKHALVWFCGDIWPSPVETRWLQQARVEGGLTPLDIQWTSLLGLIRMQNHVVAHICHDTEWREISGDPREEVHPESLVRGFGYAWGRGGPPVG